MMSDDTKPSNPELSKAISFGDIAERLILNAPVGIYIVQDGRIAITNHALRTILGYREEDILSRSPVDLVHPSDKKAVKASVEEMYEHGNTGSTEYRVFAGSGEIKWILTYSQLIDTALRSLYSTFIVDITQRKKVEENLSRSEQRFRDLTESTSDMIWEIDTEGVYRYVNPQIEHVTGYTPDEVIDKISFFDLVPPEEVQRHRKEFKGFVKHQKPLISWECLNKHKDGRLVVLSSNGLPIYDSDGKLIGYRGTDRDVTEQRNLRENLRFYINELTRAQEHERGRIARELHDETAQTLSRVCTECDILISQKKPLPQETSQRLTEIREIMKSVLHKVRRFSLELRPALLDRLGLVPSLELLVQEVNEEKDIRCRLEAVDADRRMSPDIELASFRIVQEAIRNARRYAKAAEVLVSVEHLGSQLNITVSDDGIGFDVPEVLTSFARTGQLGLIGVSERVRALNGTLMIESGTGKGTKIFVMLPE